MNNKNIFYTEIAYLVGIIILALGTALMTKSDMGVSMVVAPAYIIHLKVSQYLPFFSFGMAEYTLQALILLALFLIMGKFKKSYLFSFVTAVLYGLALDFMIWLVDFVPCDDGYTVRVILFVVGMQCSSIGVSMFFHTYISAEAYELFVKELSDKYNIKISRFKTCYDCASCIVSICLSFAFFGLWHFEGVKAGTVICALANGTLIGFYSGLFEKHFEYKDKFDFRKYF